MNWNKMSRQLAQAQQLLYLLAQLQAKVSPDLLNERNVYIMWPVDVNPSDELEYSISQLAALMNLLAKQSAKLNKPRK